MNILQKYHLKNLVGLLSESTSGSNDFVGNVKNVVEVVKDGHIYSPVFLLITCHKFIFKALDVKFNDRLNKRKSSQVAEKNKEAQLS